MAWFEPLVPKNKTLVNSVPMRRALELRMWTLVNDLQRLAMTYETPAPDPKSYVRTNTLKRSWSRSVEWKGGALVGEVKSSGQIAPYNVYVRGPKAGPKGRRQAAHMAARGWMTVTDLLDKEWPIARQSFQRILKAGK